MNNIFFSSDFHFGHSNIAGPNTSKWTEGYRMFSSTEEMDKHIINNINKKVGEDDNLYCLGDWCFGSPSKALFYRKKINCKNIYLIKGNHDTVNWASHNDIFIIQDYFEFKVNKQHIVLFHYPIESWHWINRGSWHLHGHVHGKFFDKNRNINRLDVGIDSYYQYYGDYNVFSFEEIQQTMKDKNAKYYNFS